MIRPEEQVELSGFVTQLVKAGILLPLADDAIIRAYYVGYRGAMADMSMAAAGFVTRKSEELTSRLPITPIVDSPKSS